MIKTESVLVKKNSIASRIVEEGEAVIVKPDTAELRTLNEVGSRIWELVDGEKDVEKIIQIIRNEFDETSKNDVEKEIIEFCRELREKDLVEIKNNE